MNRILRFSLALLLLAAVLATAGCARSEEAREYTVTYSLNGLVLQQQTVAQGECPQAFVPQLDGVDFVGWNDGFGAAAQPEQTAVESDVEYKAVAYPRLERHSTYLKLNGEGNLLPDSVLTGDDLTYALEQLAEEASKTYFPALPTGTAPVEKQALVNVLSRFFPRETVQAQISGTGLVTRGEFAGIMHALLGRDDQEVFRLAENAILPKDVYQENPLLTALLDASVEHTSDEEGIRWMEMEIISGYEPGFVNLNGYLYYVKEDHYFLRDGKVGKLQFGTDGRYSSGDAELDDMVASVLAPIVAENPGATRLELLRLVYEHCHMDYTYLRKEAYGMGDHSWEIDDAKEMFSKGKGNCYNFAAIFWACARGLGYEARAVAGTCTSTNQPHGWVIIKIDGADYFFDPEWQYAYRERGDEGHDMFMIPMNKINYWKYRWRE